MTIEVLFLCTGNSCRSIMAESLLRHLASDRFASHSAGSSPAGKVNPNSMALLERRGHDTSVLRSKSWDEFDAASGITFDYIFTLCDNAASEPCPVWPGHPVRAHWGLPDPYEATGSDEEITAAYEDAYRIIENRVQQFLALPNPGNPDQGTKDQLHQIGLS